jgi:putative DNA methylase
MANTKPPDDKRLIEDYLPIEAISAEASREKSVRKGHISTLHLWWARRPLVACRAAVYGALVPAERWVKEIELKTPPEDAEKAEKIRNGKKKGLNRKAAREFVTKLCRYPKSNPTKAADVRLKRETEAAIVEAQRHILEAHADRLTAELLDAKVVGKLPAWVAEFKFTGEQVSYDDIENGRAPRPRVLDMFAGGGAIPLEALRLGCEAHALDLNPVAHIIELCTLVYPQKFGKPDPSARGMTGPKNAKGETTWGGLAAEVRHWGTWVLDRVRKEIGDLYPPIPDPEVWEAPPDVMFDCKTGAWLVTNPGKPKCGARLTQSLLSEDDSDDAEDEETNCCAATLLPSGFLQPVAYLWTRAVRCKRPGCSVQVPLVKQGWLCAKKGRFVAVRPVANEKTKTVQFRIVSVASEDELDFDPSNLGSGKGTACPVCATPIDLDYIKAEGASRGFSHIPMAVVATRGNAKGKHYFPSTNQESFDVSVFTDRLQQVERDYGITVPEEVLEANPRSFDVQNFGFKQWRSVFTERQLVAMTSFAGGVKLSMREAESAGLSHSYAEAVTVTLSMVLGRMADYQTAFCTWQPEFIKNTFNAPGLPMIFDFAEADPLAGSSGSWGSALGYVCAAVASFAHVCMSGSIARGSAVTNSHDDNTFDAVVTDPPYYDSRSYSNLADHFYVWHKRAIGHLFPEHFSGGLTPKKNEAIAAPYRHGGSHSAADEAYEILMQKAFAEACRVLKPERPMVCVYAHKTTAGWATLINSMMKAGFTVVEAWPVDMERRSRQNAQQTAALASSIFLVARKREVNSGVGKYEDDVQPELQQIVRERVDTLWEMGVAGADLVIAAVGAGLRAFTKYEKVEYANGEEVPAEKFLAEVEGAVLDTMMGKLFGQSGASVSAIDPASRFYVLWRFVYKTTEIEAGEAIVFTYAQHVELDGPNGLSTGKDALLEKKKSKYRVRDYSERGDNDKLGLPSEEGQSASLIDVLHRVLWLMEHSPRSLGEFLMDSHTDRERLRVLAQTLAGPALSGKSEADTAQLVGTTAAEQASLGKLLANWRSVVEDQILSTNERADIRRGQKRLSQVQE